MSYGSRFTLTLFTDQPDLASDANVAGVERIGPDLERLGKPERQGGMNTWISDHSEECLGTLRARIQAEKLFARCNPIHSQSKQEINRLIGAGVRSIMLPYFHSTEEAAFFLRLTDGRCHPILLVETAESAAQIEAICKLHGVGEIHFGLNDLRLSLGWPSHFHVLVSDLLKEACAVVLHAGLKLAVGGVGRAGDNELPIPADLVLAQYPRLGATGALLSRAFFRAPAPSHLPTQIRALRQKLDEFSVMSHSELDSLRTQLAKRLDR